MSNLPPGYDATLQMIEDWTDEYEYLLKRAWELLGEEHDQNEYTLVEDLCYGLSEHFRFTFEHKEREDDLVTIDVPFYSDDY